MARPNKAIPTFDWLRLHATRVERAEVKDEGAGMCASGLSSSPDCRPQRANRPRRKAEQLKSQDTSTLAAWQNRPSADWRGSALWGHAAQCQRYRPRPGLLLVLLRRKRPARVLERYLRCRPPSHVKGHPPPSVPHKPSPSSCFRFCFSAVPLKHLLTLSILPIIPKRPSVLQTVSHIHLSLTPHCLIVSPVSPCPRPLLRPTFRRTISPTVYISSSTKTSMT